MPNGLGERLKKWLDTLEEGGAEADELTAAYNAYLRYLELIARTYPELDEGEKQALALRQAELDWSRERFGLEQQRAKLPYEQMTAYQRAQQEQAWLPYQQMTAYQQAQTQLSQMQYAAQLAGLGEAGWIEQWYAQQAQQAQFEPRQQPWYMKGQAAIPGWGEMKPEERAEWIRRRQYSTWAGIDPTIQQRVQAGYGWPQAPPEGMGYGQPSTAPWADIPSQIYTGERKAEVPQLTPEQYGQQELARWTGQPTPTFEGEAGISPTIPHPRGPSTGFQAPPFPVGEAPPKGGRARPPRPTAPPTPEWLPQFAPWLTAGQPITAGQMPTPSGQMWGGVSPSVQAGLRGFTKWGGAGRSMEDIYAHMLQMQPQEPWGGRGVWRAARQI